MSAAPADDPAAVRALLTAGARQLAYAQLEALQPRDRSAPRWAEWEGLRCEVLAQLDRRDALLERVAALPAGPLPVALHACLLEGARAALARGDSQTARAQAARLIWHADVSPAQLKAARLTVIESYVADARGDEAFRAMLRFTQDYRPLDRAVAERFSEALLDLKMNSEALGWVPAEEPTPSRLRLQLRSGTLTPEATIAQARAALARSQNARYWRTIHEAALRSGDAAHEIEALERLLEAADRRDVRTQASAAQRLWQAYLSTAVGVANREQLLIGDDGAWADAAARRLGSNPFLARAFYAYLAQHAQNAEIRGHAQFQLAHSLHSAGLEHTALRVMLTSGLAIDVLDPRARYLLGTIAARHNEPALALKLWQGLTAPASVNAIEWALTVAAAALQAGDAPGTAERLKRLLASHTSVSAELARRVLEIGQEMLDMRSVEAAQTVYGTIVPLAPEAEAREALFGLGRAHELAGHALEAAGHYLRSALRSGPAQPDHLTFQARLLAALNLMRAGLKDDARAQFEWLLKNSKDPALTEAARRALERL